MKHEVFTTFSKVRLGDDCIKLYKLRTCMAMQKKVLMNYFLLKKFLFFLKIFVLGGIFLMNQHLFVLNGMVIMLP